MNAFSDEVRLLWTVLLNGGVLICAWELARRRGTGGAVQAICDALLLYFLVQYAAVALPGCFGVLNGLSMSLVAFVAAGGMLLGAFRMRGNGATAAAPSLSAEAEIQPAKRESLARRTALFTPRYRAAGEREAIRSTAWTADHFALLACTLFAGGFLLVYAYTQRLLPPIATDALVYHLPTAVQWIQTGRLGIYPAWYWNPAASYSPATGSTFMAWWMIPAANDVFVRFVQLPPLMFIFFLVVRMCRLMGATRGVSGCLAIAATLSRPLFSEAIFPKDDLYVTSFIAAGIVSLCDLNRQTFRQPAPAGSSFQRRESALAASLEASAVGACRVGVAIGFVLASKYTALLMCPIFLFLLDAPFRGGWKVRHWSMAAGIGLAMALPWYLRNLLLTGNPLYPVDVHLPGVTLRGLFGAERDQQLRTAGGVWQMLANTYHSLPTPLIVLLLAGWLLAALVGGKSLLRDGLARTCVIGSPLALLFFLATSPHHEIRYVFPLIVLWFAACGFALARAAGLFRRDRSGAIVAGQTALLVAIGIALTSALTTFSRELISSAVEFAGAALLITTVGVGLTLLQARLLHLSRQRLATVAAAVALVLATWAYVEWHAYVASYGQTRLAAWEASGGYPRPAEIWKWVDEKVPANAPVAYANTFFVYPYYGFNFTRPVGYAPTRHGLDDFAKFPRMGDRVPGDLIVRRMTHVMNADPDRETWLENLRALHAEYLVVMKHDPDNPDLSADPPELRLARAAPRLFVPVEETEAGIVFRIGEKTPAAIPR